MTLTHIAFYAVLAIEAAAIVVLGKRALAARRWLKINGRITDALWPSKNEDERQS